MGNDNGGFNYGLFGRGGPSFLPLLCAMKLRSCSGNYRSWLGLTMVLVIGAMQRVPNAMGGRLVIEGSYYCCSLVGALGAGLSLIKGTGFGYQRLWGMVVLFSSLPYASCIYLFFLDKVWCLAFEVNSDT